MSEPTLAMLIKIVEGRERGEWRGHTVFRIVRICGLSTSYAVLVRVLSCGPGFHGIRVGSWPCKLVFSWAKSKGVRIRAKDIGPAGIVLLPQRVKQLYNVGIENIWREDGSMGYIALMNMGVIIDRDPEKPHVAVCRFSDGPNPVPDFTSLVVELALLDLGPRPKLEEKDGYWLPPEDPVYLDIWQHIVL